MKKLVILGAELKSFKKEIIECYCNFCSNVSKLLAYQISDLKYYWFILFIYYNLQKTWKFLRTVTTGTPWEWINVKYLDKVGFLC